MTHSLSTLLFSVFITEYLYIYIYPTAASPTRAMFAGKTRARQRRAYTSPFRPSKFSRGRQVRGPSAAKSSRESTRVAKKIGWQRASFQFQRDFVMWHKGQRSVEVGTEKKRSREEKGQAEWTIPFVSFPFSLSFSSRTCANPPEIHWSFWRNHLSSSSVHWKILLNAHCRNILYLSYWLRSSFTTHN